MLEFYYFPNTVLMLFFIIGTAFVGLQAANTWLIAFNNLNKRKPEFICELLLLVYVMFLVITPIHAFIMRQQGVFNVIILSKNLYIAGIPSIIMCLYLCFFKKFSYSLPLFFIVLSLPYMSKLNFYVSINVVTTSVLMLRALMNIFREELRRQREVSAFSIKQGMDSLPAGVMYSGIDGYIYLVNSCMLELMDTFFGSEQKDAKKFWENLISCKASSNTYPLSDSSVMLRSDTSTWFFRQKTFVVNNVTYSEILATEITVTDRNLLALEKDREALIEQNAEIEALTEKIVSLQKNQEYLRIRSQIHDVMGQRLTAIQRILQSQTSAGYAQIIPLLQNIVENIREEKRESAGELLLELTLYFKKVGVEIDVTGNLPKDEIVAYAFLSVLREATTNAARHADATKVLVSIEKNIEEYIFTIANNGVQPVKQFKEGGGLSGMRRRVENIRGTFIIEWTPKFNIRIIIPKNNGVGND